MDKGIRTVLQAVAAGILVLLIIDPGRHLATSLTLLGVAVLLIVLTWRR